MGKLNKQSDSDEAMQIELPHPQAKHKKIKKKLERTITQTQQSKKQNKSSKPSQSKLRANKVVRRLSKMVNLQKQKVQLVQKQGIFKKIVQDMKGDKKVGRKQQKKQRVLIKKKLRQEFQEKLPKPNTTENHNVEAMQQEKRTIKKEKFQQTKVVEEFKKNMGLKFGSLKQILANKANS